MKKRKNIKINTKKALYATAGITTTGVIAVSATIPLFKNNSKGSGKKENKTNVQKSIAIDDPRSSFILLTDDVSLPDNLESEINIIGTKVPNDIANDALKKQNLKTSGIETVQKLINKDKNKLLYIFEINSNNAQEKEANQKAYVYFDLKKLNFSKVSALTFNQEKLVNNKEVRLNSSSLNNENQKNVEDIKELIIKEKAAFVKERLEQSSNLSQDLILPNNLNEILPKDLNENQILFKENNFLEFSLKKENNNSLLDSEADFKLTIKEKGTQKNIEEFNIIVKGLKSKSKEEFDLIDKKTIEDFLISSETVSRSEVLAQTAMNFLPVKHTITNGTSTSNVSFNFEYRVGLINWTAFVIESRYGYTKEFTGILNGYKIPNYSEDEIKEANKEIKKIKESLSLPELKDNINTEETIASQVKVKDFKSIWVKNSSFKAKIIKLQVNPSNSKQLLIDIKLESTKFAENDVPSLTKRFILEGFITQNELNDKNKLKEKRRIESELLNIDVIFNKNRDDFLLDENKSLILKLLDISNIDDTQKTFNYKIVNNGETLEVNLEYKSLKVPDLIVKKTLYLEGFLNEDEFYKNTLDKYYDFLSQDNLSNFKLKSGELKNQKPLSTLLIDDFIILDKNNYSKYVDLTLNYLSTDKNIKENNANTSADDNTTGFLHWTLKSKKYDIERLGTTKLENFANLKAIKELEKNKKLENEFNNVSSDDIKNAINSQINISDARDELSVNDINEPNKFTFDFGDPKLNIEIEVIEWIKDKSKGEIQWDANVITTNLKNNRTRTFSGALTGFKIESESDAEKAEKAEINKKLDETLDYLEKVSEDFKNLKDQGHQANKLITHSGKFVSVNLGYGFHSPWGIPALYDYTKNFSTNIRNNGWKRKNVKLTDYNINSNWEEGIKKSLDPSNSKGKINTNLLFKVDSNSARMNPDDTSQLLVDINFYSKKYPYLKRKYTVTYTGFKSLEIKDEDIVKKFNKTLEEQLNSYGDSVGIKYLYRLFAPMLNSINDEKYQTFYNELFSPDFKTKISWGQFDQFLNIINKIKNTNIFKELEDEVNNWKTRIIDNDYKYSSSKENPWKKIEPLISRLTSTIFSQDYKNAPLISEEQNLLKFGSGVFARIVYAWTTLEENATNSKKIIKMKFADTDSSRSGPKKLLTSDKYWKNLLGITITSNNFWTNFNSLNNKISFIEMNPDKKLKAKISYVDDKYGFDTIWFEIDLNERFFINDDEKIQKIKEDIENDSNPLKILDLKNNVFPSRMSASKLTLSNIDLLFDNIDSKNFDFELMEVSQNSIDETIADVTIRISSKAFPGVFQDVKTQITGFATTTKIEEQKKQIKADQNELNNFDLTIIQNKFAFNNMNLNYDFAEDVIKPEGDHDLGNDIIGRFTIWKINDQTIEYEMTLSKGSAIRKINGEITGFKAIKNTDDNLGNINTQKDKNITSEIWKLYYQTNINPSKYDDLEQNQKNIIKNILESAYLKDAIDNDSLKLKNNLEQLEKIINYDEIYIESIIFDKLKDSASLGINLVIKSKIHQNFEQKISFIFENLSNSFEEIRDHVSEIKIDAKGVELTSYSSINSLFLNTILSNDNDEIISNIMLNNLKNNDGGINNEILAKYILRVIQIKLKYTKKDNNKDFGVNFLFKEFIENLFNELILETSFKEDDKNTKLISLRNLADDSNDIVTEVLNEYSQSEIFTDLKELVSKIAGEFIDDQNEKQTFINSFLDKLSFKISEISNNYDFSIYLKNDADDISAKHIGSIDTPQNKDSNYIKMNFKEFIENFENYLKHWKANGLLMRNKTSSKVFKLKIPIVKEFFQNSVLSGTGNRADISSVKGLNIFGEIIINIFKKNSDQEFRFSRSTGRYGSGESYAQSGPFKGISHTNLTFGNADDVNDIYADLN